MADHVINLDPFNPMSVMRADRLLKRYIREFEEKVDIFMEELANFGAEVAQAAYGGEVSVTVEAIENGFAIIASGRRVAFLEFGAGDTVDSGNIFASEMPFEVRSGSWSETHAHEYERKQRWHYEGTMYTAIAPTDAMQTAYEQIMDNWQAIAEEVFG